MQTVIIQTIFGITHHSVIVIIHVRLMFLNKKETLIFMGF